MVRCAECIPLAGGGVGQFSIGTFTADGASQSFTITGLAAGTPNTQMNALQLRDVTGGTTNAAFAEHITRA